MGGDAKTAAQREICKFTTSAHEAGSETMPKKISSRSVPVVTEPDIFIAKSPRTARRTPGEMREHQRTASEHPTAFRSKCTRVDT